MKTQNVSVKLDPPTLAALSAIANEFHARGMTRVGVTTILKRAAVLGLPLLQQEVSGPHAGA